MFYGLFLYGYQGQYSINPSPQTISPYWALVVSLTPDSTWLDTLEIAMNHADR